MSLLKQLQTLEKPIRVGLVGVGQMGVGLLAQTERIPGMEVVAAADITAERALAMSDRIVVMNLGRAQQIGTPQEIYESPANPFVAGFIGFANFIDAEVTHREAGTLSLRLQFGELSHTIQCDSANGHVHDNAVVVVRPENVNLSSPETSSLTGQVLRRVYLGNRLDYLVAVGSAQLRAEANPVTGVWNEGETVGLTLSRVVVLPASGDER